MSLVEAFAQASHLAETLSISIVFFMGLAAAVIGGRKPRTLAGFLWLYGLHIVFVGITAVLLMRDPSASVAVVRAIALLAGAYASVGAWAAFLFDLALPKIGVSVPTILQNLVVLILTIILSVTVASRSGFNFSGLVATSAVLTAVIGLSLQDVISNIAGGIALQIDRALSVGDWLKVNDVSGRVVGMTWRATSIQTRNGETVLIPNTFLMKNQVTVIGSNGGRQFPWRRWVYFTVDWKYSPSDVISLTTTAVRAAKLSGVAKTPPPTCVLFDLAQPWGRYAVRYWLAHLNDEDATDSEVRNSIFFALERADMKVATPVETRVVDPAVIIAREAASHLRRVRLLKQLELFRTLSDQELDQLAHELQYSPFAPGDVVTAQGAVEHWLYVVEKGRVSLRVDDGESEVEYAQVAAPNFFGEYSLLTGAPRSATIVALTGLECFRLEKSAVKPLLERRPDLVRELAELMAKRQETVAAAKEGLEIEPDEPQVGDLLGKIRRFFTLE